MSSPETTASSPEMTTSSTAQTVSVGLVYDERMCAHATPDGEDHPENPDRIRAIWRKLHAEGIIDRCVVLDAKEAKDEHIMSVHSRYHVNLIKKISSKELDSRRKKIASKFNSIYLNKGSSQAAYLAAGSVVEICDWVARGDLRSGMAIVRPPGHHAEANEAMGFCLFNNVAIAASYLLNKRSKFGIKKIMIVDWDVHHGNGTQNMFYRDDRVLFFSVHRFDSGSFYPAGCDGAHFMTGEGRGAGYNINVPWEHAKCGDADYNAVWDHVLIPIADAYNPDIVLVSAGFDAALGDPLGGCCLTPYGYSLLLSKLMRFAQGKIVMALEGGYNLNSIANSVLSCAQTLLEGKPIAGSLNALPFNSTWHTIQEVRHELKTYWPVLATELPPNILIGRNEPSPLQADLGTDSESDVENDDGAPETILSENVIKAIEDVIEPLSKMNVNEDNHGKTISLNKLEAEADTSKLCNSEQASEPAQLAGNHTSWRSVLSNVAIWYASYGSNMWKERFFCYIKGGMVEGMTKTCIGSRDKNLPRDVFWKSIPHRLFFGRSHSDTWAKGGVAFLNPESSSGNAYVCIYKISLEQFNDLLFQENAASQPLERPYVDLPDLDFVMEKSSMPLKALKGGWYSNLLCLGKHEGIPILTMTCLSSDLDSFKSGELPVCAPAKAYVNALVRGLVEGEHLSTPQQALDYVNTAINDKL